MDGLKARLSFDAVAYDYDDEYLTIDTDTHTININNVSRLFGVQYDGNSKLIKFRIRNKLSDIQKMQDSIVYINWIDSKGVKGQSIAINKIINNDTCEFAWKVPFDALKNSGVLHFAMNAVVTKNSSSVIDQRWSTQIASVTTPDGIYIKSYTPSSEEEDRIAQIYNELSNMINKQNDNLNDMQAQVNSLKEEITEILDIKIGSLIDDFYILTTNGKAMPSSAYKMTDYIYIKNVGKIVYPILTRIANVGLAFYSDRDESTFISGYDIGTDVYKNKRILDVPNGAEYVRFCCLSVDYTLMYLRISSFIEGIRGKQDLLVKGVNLDEEPSKNSDNPVTSEGVYNALKNKLGTESLSEIIDKEYYPNLLDKDAFIVGKQIAVPAGSEPTELIDNPNTTVTNIIDCDGDEYFETNLTNGNCVICGYIWYQEKWYRSQFISTLETEGDHYKFKINPNNKKIRIYFTTNMVDTSTVMVTKYGEWDANKPQYYPNGKIMLKPGGCVGYNNLDEDTKQRINNKTSNYSEYIPFYGKKIVGIGDSIMVGINSDGSAIIDGIGENGLPCTDQGYQINSTGGFLGELRKKYPSINVVNMGVGSTTMQRNDNVNVNKVYKCIMDRIDNIPDDADIIILEGGINDFFHASKGCVLGTYKDNLYKYPTSAKYENGAYSYVEFAVDTTFDASTFCGALEIALTKILVRFVGKPFIYVIPHNPSASADIDTFFDSAKAICEKYGVPVVDIRKVGCMPRIYTLSGKTDGTSAFTQDGVHPNPLGYQLHYVPAIASTLKSIM